MGHPGPRPSREPLMPTAPSHRRRIHLVGRAFAVAVVLLTPVIPAGAAWADDVTVTPTAQGLSFGQTIQNMLNWGAQIALWGSLASILAGAACWGLSKHF